MKKPYISPALVWQNIYQEPLMLDLSEKIINDDDVKEYEEAAKEIEFESSESVWNQ